MNADQGAFNPKITKRTSSPYPSADRLLKELRSGNRTVLARCITLIESHKPEDLHLAQTLLNLCMPYAGNSIRIGITGVPGVGKSTFIEHFGNLILTQGHQLAVFAIDPSSSKSKGSILGDKTRMETLAQNNNAFIRPTPSGNALGGVSQNTRQAIVLAETAGFDVIFIETVGVGQNEIAVKNISDFFLLLMLAGAGDELQGIKRGIMEMADLFCITKADGLNINAAKTARSQVAQALHLFQNNEHDWIPQVLTCSATTQTGLDAIWNNIVSFNTWATANGSKAQKRIEQQKLWYQDLIQDHIKHMVKSNSKLKDLNTTLENQIADKIISPIFAANTLLDALKTVINPL